MVYCTFCYDDNVGTPILMVDIYRDDMNSKKVVFEICKDEFPGIVIVEDEGDFRNAVFFVREEILKWGLNDMESLLEWVGVKEWDFQPWDTESKKNFDRFDREIREFLNAPAVEHQIGLEGRERNNENL